MKCIASVPLGTNKFHRIGHGLHLKDDKFYLFLLAWISSELSYLIPLCIPFLLALDQQ